MTVEGFRSNVKGYRRSERVRGALFIASLGVASLPTMFVLRRLDRVGFDTVAAIVVSVSYATLAAVMFYVLVPMRRTYLEKLQGNCPACGKLLLGRRSRAVMIRGQCPDCGRQVLQ